jgi:small conductance mechanosensitive channel
MSRPSIQNDKLEHVVDATQDIVEKSLEPLWDNFSWLKVLYDKAAEVGWSIVGAIITITVGFWIAGKVRNWIERRMIAKEVDASARTFVIPIINFISKGIVLISVISNLGFNITGIIGLLSAAAVAVGLALQGSLSNLAGGILIIIFKPFKVGDYIVTNGNEGTVESISILYTELLSSKGQVITIPNSKVYDSAIINYSIKPYRRLDVNIGIGYDDDFDTARSIILDVLKAEELVDKDQNMTVEILDFGDSSVNLAVRAFIKTEDYWSAYWRVHRNIKYALDHNNISIPFPQREVTIHK